MKETKTETTLVLSYRTEENGDGKIQHIHLPATDWEKNLSIHGVRERFHSHTREWDAVTLVAAALVTTETVVTTKTVKTWDV